MEPISAIIAAALFGIRSWTRSKRKNAAEEYSGAIQDYKTARASAVQEHVNCVNDLHFLASCRKSCVSRQFPRLDALASHLGIKDEFFSKTGIFGGRSKKDLHSLVRASRSLVVPHYKLSGDAVILASGAALVIQGIQFVDRCGLANLPIMHSTLHQAFSALPFDHAGQMAEALGDGIGALNVADLFGDALLVFGAFRCFSNLTKADQLKTGAAELNAEALKLNHAKAAMETIRQRVGSLCGELEATSYEVFRWTLIAEEAACIKRFSQGWKPRSFRLPRWILERLRSSTAQLWASLQKPAIT